MDITHEPTPSRIAICVTAAASRSRQRGIGLTRCGVFAAYDYDVVPVIDPRVDAAFARVIDVRWDARERLGV